MTQIVHSSRRATRKKRTACENLFIVIVRGRGVLADMSDPFIARLILLLFCETIRYIALFPIYDISHCGLQRRGGSDGPVQFQSFAHGYATAAVCSIEQNL